MLYYFSYSWGFFFPIYIWFQEQSMSDFRIFFFFLLRVLSFLFFFLLLIALYLFLSLLCNCVLGEKLHT